MRKLLFIPLFLIAISGFAQDTTTGKIGRLKALQNDSFARRLQEINDSLQAGQYTPRFDTKLAEEIMHNVSERKKREKRNAYIRIGFGVLMFAVLLIGLRRRSARARKV